MKIGILGTGPMAQVFSKTLLQMKDVIELEAIGSRSLEKAIKFKDEYGFNKAYGDLDDFINDKDVELIYIASPHSAHYEQMEKCILAHKAVLCEKAFTVNAKQAKQIKELAQKEKVFVAEAMWPRYMPSRALINDAINSGLIGKPYTLTANLSYVISQNDRLTNPLKAGGALLDVGVYGINMAIQCFGSDIERIESSVQMTDTGVDGMESITMFYKDGKMAVLTHGMYARSDRKAIIYGDKGYIVIENINNPYDINVYDCEDKLLKHYEVPKQISGYEYEVLECNKCLKQGLLEAPSMKLSESIELMEICDKIRNIWNLRYPFE